ncbi:MAG: S41 family peptidase [Magnetospirillum sp.]|nr:S41 family peptidase [Magnetospirillum sp.]
MHQVTAASAALDGMRGLATLDPRLGVARMGNRVVLSYGDRDIAEYPAAKDEDADGWAKLTLAAALDARNVSAPVRNADIEKVYQVVFDASLAKLDRFSRYASAKEAASHRAARNGFGGLGLTFELAQGQARIEAVMADTPASHAGLAAGDVIASIDGSPVGNLDHDAVFQRLRGPVGSDVVLAVRHGNSAPMDLSLTRALIVPQTVTSSVHDGFAEFKISSFNQRTAVDLTAALKAARARLGPSMKGVVLDLRGNPGGLLDQAVTVADLFMAKGPIVTTRGRHPLANQFYEAHAGDIGEDLPVVVLVDGRSASAAEILAGALEDSGRAVVVGTNSYGKGTVQTVLRLPNDGEMTLTWSRYYPPSGYALHGLGVLPTICTANTAETPDMLLNRVVHASNPAPVTAELAEWRSARLDDTDLRGRLRSTCPSAKHADAKADTVLAEKLLAEPGAYAHALAMSAPPNAPAMIGAASDPASTQQVLH